MQLKQKLCYHCYNSIIIVVATYDFQKHDISGPRFKIINLVVPELKKKVCDKVRIKKRHIIYFLFLMFLHFIEIYMAKKLQNENQIFTDDNNNKIHK